MPKRYVKFKPIISSKILKARKNKFLGLTYESIKLKFINLIMRKGKKQLARRILTECLFYIKKKTLKNPYLLLYKALNNSCPTFTFRLKRIGSQRYKIPIPIKTSKCIFLGIKWIIDASFSKNKLLKTFSQRLAFIIIQSAAGKGSVIKRKQDLYSSSLLYKHLIRKAYGKKKKKYKKKAKRRLKYTPELFEKIKRLRKLQNKIRFMKQSVVRKRIRLTKFEFNFKYSRLKLKHYIRQLIKKRKLKNKLLLNYKFTQLDENYKLSGDFKKFHLLIRKYKEIFYDYNESSISKICSLLKLYNKRYIITSAQLSIITNIYINMQIKFNNYYRRLIRFRYFFKNRKYYVQNKYYTKLLFNLKNNYLDFVKGNFVLKRLFLLRKWLITRFYNDRKELFIDKLKYRFIIKLLFLKKYIALYRRSLKYKKLTKRELDIYVKLSNKWVFMHNKAYSRPKFYYINNKTKDRITFNDILKNVFFNDSSFHYQALKKKNFSRLLYSRFYNKLKYNYELSQKNTMLIKYSHLYKPISSLTYFFYLKKQYSNIQKQYSLFLIKHRRGLYIEKKFKKSKQYNLLSKKKPIKNYIKKAFNLKRTLSEKINIEKKTALPLAYIDIKEKNNNMPIINDIYENIAKSKLDINSLAISQLTDVYNEEMIEREHQKKFIFKLNAKNKKRIQFVKYNPNNIISHKKARSNLKSKFKKYNNKAKNNTSNMNSFNNERFFTKSNNTNIVINNKPKNKSR